MLIVANKRPLTVIDGHSLFIPGSLVLYLVSSALQYLFSRLPTLALLN